MNGTIVCVGHDGNRAGAQIVLLNTARWLRSRHDGDLVILLTQGGPLVDDYQTIAPTVVVGAPEPGGRRPTSATDSPEVDRPAHLGQLLRVIPNGVELVYANSVASVHVVRELKAMWQCPVLCHVRELEMGIQQYFGVERFRAAQPFIDAYVAGSAAVEANLVLNHDVPTSRIHRIATAIRLSEADHDGVGPQHAQWRRELGVPPDAFLVGGSGAADWRKGPDLFLQVARHVLAHRGAPPVHFVWIGGDGMALEYLRRDTMMLGLGDRVHWVGSVRDPRSHFSQLGAFLMVSREDPFPLVCLEAAAFQVPIICFRDAGGMPEFVEDDAGIIVPYLDVEGAASSVLALACDGDLRRRLGSRAEEKVRARHDIDKVGPQLLDLFQRYAEDTRVAKRRLTLSESQDPATQAPASTE
jgi:glycosyltransferase involved in cell wall biosynthesis